MDALPCIWVPANSMRTPRFTHVGKAVLWKCAVGSGATWPNTLEALTSAYCLTPILGNFFPPLTNCLYFRYFYSYPWVPSLVHAFGHKTLKLFSRLDTVLKPLTPALRRLNQVDPCGSEASLVGMVSFRPTVDSTVRPFLKKIKIKTFKDVSTGAARPFWQEP